MMKPLKNLLAKMPPEDVATARARADQLLAEMPLHELRRVRELSQHAIATIMGTSQGEVSKIEHRADMYISTVRSYIEAAGGTLDIIASFPDGDVRINQFEDLADAKVAAD